MLIQFDMNSALKLRTIKLVHTVAWAFFAGCILSIPFFAFRGEFSAAFLLSAIVLAEVVVVLVNRWRCPLTDVAERYTDRREANFDIYLPLWLARYNKEIFGSLFFIGFLYTIARWQGWLA